MNTTIRNTALASILFAAASGVFAAESADLTVKGVIKPAACTPTLTGGGIVDFGTISANALSATDATVLSSKDVNLTITCDAATKVGIALADNRSGTANASAGSKFAGNSSHWFGAGSVEGKNVGAYAVYFGPDSGLQATADGANVDTIYNNADWANTSQWVVSASKGIAQPGNRVHSWGVPGTLAPGAFKTIAQPVRVALAIGKISELPALTQEIPVDGSATISIRYL